MPSVTERWNRSPPLYGPSALFICMRKPRLTWISPRSSCHGTRNIITRSGSTMRSRIFALREIRAPLDDEVEALEHLLHRLVELAARRGSSR